MNTNTPDYMYTSKYKIGDMVEYDSNRPLPVTDRIDTVAFTSKGIEYVFDSGDWVPEDSITAVYVRQAVKK